jgi:hypothetical protein
MQQKNRSPSHFSQLTEDLAARLGRQLGDLPPIIGISPRMFYGYRSGKYPITEKAWRKLAAAEDFAELRDASSAAIKGAATKAVDQRDFERLIKEEQPALEERRQRLAAKDAEIAAMPDEEEADPLDQAKAMLAEMRREMNERLTAVETALEKLVQPTETTSAGKPASKARKET